MAQIISEDPKAYENCPFCGYALDPVVDYDESSAYTDDHVHVDWYICPQCGARAEVRYTFADVTWTIDD